MKTGGLLRKFAVIMVLGAVGGAVLLGYAHRKRAGMTAVDEPRDGAVWSPGVLVEGLPEDIFDDLFA